LRFRGFELVPTGARPPVPPAGLLAGNGLIRAVATVLLPPTGPAPAAGPVPWALPRAGWGGPAPVLPLPLLLSGPFPPAQMRR
jgi:hypothetical protein